MCKLDWLAKEALTVLSNSGLDEAYLEEKRHRLDGVARFEVLLWLNNLDTKHLHALANRLNIAPADLETTIRVVREL